MSTLVKLCENKIIGPKVDWVRTLFSAHSIISKACKTSEPPICFPQKEVAVWETNKNAAQMKAREKLNGPTGF